MTAKLNTKTQNCILLFEGRTGSTWLARLLQQSPDISFLGEELAELESKGWNEQEQWIEKLFGDPLSFQDERIKKQTRVIGFKIKLREIVNENEFKKIIQKYKCKIIYMKRNNLVKQTISSIRAMDLFEKNGIYNLDKDNAEKALGAYKIPLERFDETLKWISSVDKKLATFINDLSLQILQVTYEDLLENYEDTLNMVFNYLDAEKVVPVQTTAKHTSDDLTDVVTNYEELKNYYIGTVYEKMFKCDLLPINWTSQN